MIWFVYIGTHDIRRLVVPPGYGKQINVNKMSSLFNIKLISQIYLPISRTINITFKFFKPGLMSFTIVYTSSPVMFKF